MARGQIIASFLLGLFLCFRGGAAQVDSCTTIGGNEFYECETQPPTALPCPADAQRTWVVDDSAQAQALAAAVNCSGGSFEAEWIGSVVVDEPIYVVDGTVLAVTGTDSTAVIDGGQATRLFTVVNATLRVSNLNVSSGSSTVGGAIAAAGSSLTFDGTSFVRNSASSNGGAVYLSDGSSVSCTGGGTFASNSAAVDGGGMYLTGSSVASCDGVWFNNTAFGRGGAISVHDASSLSWSEDATFANNTAVVHGGAIFLVASSAAWVGKAQFRSNSVGDETQTSTTFGGALAIEESDVWWSGQTTLAHNRAASSNGFGGAINAYSRSTLGWTGETTFTENHAGNGGGALTVALSSVARWSGQTAFLSNSAGGGGAVTLAGSALSWSSDTSFSGNSGTVGGAVLLYNGAFLTWTGDTEFGSNEALADGGAIGSLVVSSDINPAQSTLLLNSSFSTTFLNNTSGANGGALALLGACTLGGDLANVSFVRNSAGIAGGAVFMSSSGAGPSFTGASFDSNSAQVGGAVSIVACGNLKESSDVEPPNPTTFDRCRFTGNRAETTGGAIDTAAGFDAIVNSVFEGNAAGAGGALRLAGTASVKNCSFVDNTSDEDGGAAVSNIGFISSMANISFSDNAFDCQPETFLDYIRGDPYEVACNGCQTACDGCIFGEPLLVPTCTAVYENTNSSGGNITLEALSIEGGSWRATATSTEVLACYNVDACLGGVTGASDYCLEGYEGPYCSICSDGYTSQLRYTCSECSDRTGSIVLAVILVVMVVVAAIAVVAYVMSVEVGGNGRGMVERVTQHIPLQSVKIVIVSWQILTQFTSVANVTYPDVYQRFLNGLDVFNFDLSWLLSAGCVLDLDFHDRLLMSTIGPILALSFLAATYAAAVRIKGGVPEALPIIWNKHVSMGLLLTFFLYSSISSVLFETFACEELDDGKNYLRADYRIECDSSKHKHLEVYAGFMILLYTVGIPFWYGFLLFRDRTVLSKGGTTVAENARIASTFDLWKPYRPPVFYYEIVECGRRISLAGVVVFIYPNTAAQIAITLMLAFVFAMVSEALAPYASRWDTWLSRVGHTVVFVSMYVALLLKVDVSDEQASSQKLFEAFLVTAHVLMVVVVVAETVVLTFALRAEMREGLSPRLKKFSRRKRGVAPVDVYGVEEVSPL